MLRGTAQNPDVFFQAREARQPLLRRAARRSCRTRWTASPRCTGRHYRLFDYVGDPEAERVIVHDGLRRRDGATRRSTHLTRARREGRRAEGPALPAVLGRRTSSPRCRATVRAIAVLDRTKEPGAIGEPLYLDVVAALHEASAPRPPFARGAARHRRPLRAVVEGVHAGDGQGRLRRAGEADAAATTSPSASSTT